MCRRPGSSSEGKYLSPRGRFDSKLNINESSHAVRKKDKHSARICTHTHTY